jgi:hypothetical protein
VSLGNAFIGVVRDNVIDGRRPKSGVSSGATSLGSTAGSETGDSGGDGGGGGGWDGRVGKGSADSVTGALCGPDVALTVSVCGASLAMSAGGVSPLREGSSTAGWALSSLAAAGIADPRSAAPLASESGGTPSAVPSAVGTDPASDPAAPTLSAASGSSPN